MTSDAVASKIAVGVAATATETVAILLVPGHALVAETDTGIGTTIEAATGTVMIVAVEGAMMTEIGVMTIETEIVIETGVMTIETEIETAVMEMMIAAGTMIGIVIGVETTMTAAVTADEMMMIVMTKETAVEMTNFHMMSDQAFQP